MSKRSTSFFSKIFKTSHKDNPHYSKGWEPDELPMDKKGI